MRSAALYAIIKTGGKQYRVSEKSVISVEKLAADEGSTIELTDVLLVADGDNIRIGAPLVDGARVTATVLSTSRGRKIKGYTFKKVKNVQKHYGHRQWHTRLQIESIHA